MTDQPSPMSSSLYRIYLAIQSEQDVPLPDRKVILGDTLYAHPDAWGVVGITDAALQAFADSDFKTISSIGVVRAHVQKRATIYSKLLESPLGFDEFMELFLGSDHCVLATKQENATDDGLPKAYHKIDPKAGMFQRKGKTANFRSKIEGAFLRDMYSKVAA